MTDKAFSKQEILQMEGSILLQLNFDLTVPSSLRFIDRYTRLIAMDQKSYMLTRYLIELALMEVQFLKYPPSNIACSAIYLTNKIYRKPEAWNQVVAFHSKYAE